MPSKPKDPAARFLARCIDERLAELIGHFARLIRSVDDAFNERFPSESLDAHQRRRKRQLLAVDFTRERGDTIRSADRLLRIRHGYGEVPPVPREILGKLAELRAEHEAYLAERAAEEDWIDNAVEYRAECARCVHDGDVRPSRGDYGLDDGEDDA